MSDVNLDERGPLDILGVAIGIILTIIVGIFSITTVLGAILLIALILIKWKGLSAAIKTKGFGTGICIYIAYVIVGIGIFFNVVLELFHLRTISAETSMLYIVLFIIGLFLLPLFSKNAKKAAPFFLFLLTLGLLCYRTSGGGVGNGNDNSFASNNTSIGDTSSLTDVSIANANAINPDASNINVLDNTQNNFNIDNTTSINDNFNFNTNNNVDFNTPQENNINVVNVTNSDFTNQVVVDTNTGNITGSEGQTIGSIEQDGNNTIIKDNMGNTVLTKDENTGFIYDEQGNPSGIANNSNVNTYYDVNTGEMKTESNGTIYDSNGKIEGHIIKK